MIRGRDQAHSAGIMVAQWYVIGEKARSAGINSLQFFPGARLCALVFTKGTL